MCGANRGTYDSGRTIRDYTNPRPVRFGDPGFELPDDLRALLSTDPGERAEAAAAFTRVGEAPLPGADVSPATEAAAAFARTGELPLDLFAVGGALRPLPGATLDQRFIQGDDLRRRGGDTIDYGDTIIHQTNSITTSQAGDDLVAELEDSLRLASLGR